ncbi:hypothetical protein [Immundisolibacter cernigliae]|uniref:Uncharacterized protein n=1 Tax=Immundisolibacter cernigliae TaxID=1810504 RepID=A0A1B1YWG5_9GAMM|nr:hypothetical protein [Immundisolibacter cernigliae]ANX05194.1 hypothetical protein PG2T_14065 [Immundisolibacter cernigliae]
MAAGRVLAVRGNNDVPGKWLGAAANLAALPDLLEVPPPSGSRVVEHRHPQNAARRHLRLRAA